MNKLQSLTVLRGIAAITVIYYHIMTPTGHTFGEFGVDIFFVLSGFVIALVLDSPRITAQRFLSDRIARIVPLYWVLTFVVLAGTLIAPSLFNSTTADFGNLLKSLFFIPYRKESGLIFPMLFVGWTLNYEMMFYVVAAISLVLMRRHRLLFASALIFVIFCAATAARSHDVFGEFYSYQRIFEFPLGFVVYRLWKRGMLIKPALAVGIAIAAYVWMAYVNWNGLSRGHLLYFGIPAFLMVASSLSLESKIGSGPLTKGALLLGDASYAIYLSHPYCVEAARKLLSNAIDGFDATAPVGVAIIIVAAIGVGAALYWFVDRPLHRSARKLLQSVPTIRLRGSRLTGLNRELVTADDAPTRNVQVNRDAR
ncbi:acyltransferase [Burkholderia sp. Ac-20365]|uniref:acyltransferase family protein n=1 Tax=Burkholderia sp. Ac-20365 TaxID=2703897 RepID=UPI00197B8BEE|nr:acyltransferase [Burkholderia sp. Ac-20365]MBN3766797.1 acyltransferase [Burkholderia sp. Ac-20365]